MAPPPPATLPLQERLLRLVQTLQFAWFAGHVVLLFCTTHYSFNYITFRYYNKLAQLTYRLAFISAAATYGIVVYKGYRARMRAGKPYGAINMITDENVQYLGACSCLSSR